MTIKLRKTTQLSSIARAGLLVASFAGLAGCASVGNQASDLKLEVLSSPSPQW